MPSIPFLALILCCFLISSCREKSEKINKQAERIAADQFFKTLPEIPLSSLKNEMNQGESDLLRSFQNYDFPWQHWDAEILTKARKTQKPIFLLITNPLAQKSLTFTNTLSTEALYKDLLSQDFVCALGDTHVSPELGLIAFQFCQAANTQISFPLILYLTHEGFPISTLPIGNTKPEKLEAQITNYHAIVKDIWNLDQNYIINNSREVESLRQKTIDRHIQGLPLDHPSGMLPRETTRQALFLESARRVLSLYNKHSKVVDNIGGLIPSSVIHLLALQAAHPATYPEIRERSQSAILGMQESLTNGAIHDGVEGDFFYARRDRAWALPIFARDLSSQAQLANAFFVAGTLLNEQDMIQNAENLLSRLETHWIAEATPRSSLSEGSALNSKDVFLFEYKTLQTLLGAEHFPIAEAFYQLKPEGNISSETDFEKQYPNLNTLAPTRTPEQIAQRLNRPVESIRASISKIQNTIAKIRNENGNFHLESTIAASELALVGIAQTNRYRSSKQAKDLEKATATGERILKNYTSQGRSLFRLKEKVAARGIDYAHSINLFLNLYQVTFNPKWLQTAINLTDEAISRLGREGFPLLEVAPKDTIIATKLHHSEMIFSESTLGIFDLIFASLATLTDQERYHTQRSLLTKSFKEKIQSNPVLHTDALRGFLLGDAPLQIILEGDHQSPLFQKALAELNTPEIINYTIIRPAELPLLSNKVDLPSLKSPIRFNLVRKNNILAQSTDLSKFKKILKKSLGKKE